MSKKMNLKNSNKPDIAGAFAGQAIPNDIKIEDKEKNIQKQETAADKKKWKKIIDTALKYKASSSVQDRGQLVWIDKDLKQTIESINTEYKIPARQLINAALAIFIEDYGKVIDLHKQNK